MSRMKYTQLLLLFTLCSALSCTVQAQEQAETPAKTVEQPFDFATYETFAGFAELGYGAAYLTVGGSIRF